jgi:alpha-N-arabinofuranosidase
MPASARYKLQPKFMNAPRAAKHPFISFAAGLVAITSNLHAQELTLDLAAPGAPVSPTLYGLMTEEINHSYDGGLYAELIQNRSFKDNPAVPVHWSLVQDGGGAGAISLDQTQPVNGALTTCLKLIVSKPGKRVGIANDGYWGIPVKPATTYRLSFYAKAFGTSAGILNASIESADGAIAYAQGQTPAPGTQWQRYHLTLTTPKDVQPSNGRIVISTATPGTYWFNLVSLFPPTWHDRPNGNRPDLMQLLSEMKPTFLRLPGGNFLEGNTIADRFPWEKTLHDISLRPGHNGCWRYRASDGMGLLEFMEWCEDLNIQPVLAVYAGYSLKQQHVDPGPALEPFVNSALDEIEYVTGGPDTKWGAERVKDGHPRPFPLTYVEIGNEDDADRSHSYQGRFAQFYDAIKAKYPNLKCIDTCGPKYRGNFMEKAERTPDVIDEHFYRSAGAMEADAAHYDLYDRKGPKIFVGEWATREGKPTSNLNAALGDAAWMTGMERNSDVVIMASYAPLFVNVNPGGMEWTPDLIGYDNLTSYGSPSYYAQKMFNNYLGDKIVRITTKDIPTQTWQPPARKNASPGRARQLPALFFSATRRGGTIYLKVVNASGTPQTVGIELKGAMEVSPGGISVVLRSATPQDTNSISDPVKIVPVASKIGGISTSFRRTFAPYSINVLQMEAM